jgi:predicted HicB family RNase H-like nuclease
MDTSPFLEAVRGDLQAVTAGDDAAASVAERLSRALESSLQLHLLDAIGQAALELSEQMPSGHVEVRLSGRDVQLVLADAPEPEPEPITSRDDEGGPSRLTLRMPEALKLRVERAAAAEGVSTNAWLVRAVTRDLDQRRPTRRVGNRITGFAQS